MAKFNSENERIKREYLEWEKEANGKSERSINNITNSIYLFEKFTDFKSFEKLNKKTIVKFKKDLKKKINSRTSLPVSKTYLLHTVKELMNFFTWLSKRKGYKQKINPSDIEYFKLSDKEIQAAKSEATKKVPTLEQIESVVKNMPAETEVQKRDRALLSFIVLTGIRVNALKSIKLKHVRIEEGYVEQDPKEVDTKFSKRIISYFFPVQDIFKETFLEWVNFLKKEKHFGYDVPLFPKIKIEHDENDQFKGEFLDVVPFKSTTPIRDIVKKAFESAGIDYHNPHSFRDTLIRCAYKVCKTPEDFKAWSQNIGHSSPLTTFTSYGHIDTYKQGEIIKRLDRENKDKEYAANKAFMDGIKKLMARHLEDALREAKSTKQEDV